MKHFFLIYGDGKAAPTKKHTDLTEARNEAARLALKHPGTTFHVLEPICSARATEPAVRWCVSYEALKVDETYKPLGVDQMSATEIENMLRQYQVKNLQAMAQQRPQIFAPPPPMQITPDDAMRAQCAVQNRGFIEDFQP